MDNVLLWPDWVLRYLTVALVAAFAIWLLFTLISKIHRNRYNLTIAETERAGAAPEFLNPDNSRKSDMLASGAKFEQRGSGVDIATPGKHPLERWTLLTRILTAVLALVSLLASVLGAIASVEHFNNIGLQLTQWQSFLTLVQTHWMGASIVVLVILIEIGRFMAELGR